MTVSVVRLADVAPQPWRNGGGVTRELARRPTDGDFEWRLSVADVAADGPFSSFPGVDRILVLLRGNGMTLRFGDDGSTVRLDQPTDLLAFAGERPVDAVLHDGPTLDLNLMWRRGHLDVSSEAMPCVAAHRLADRVATVLVVVAVGSAALPSGDVLEVGDCLVVEGGAPPALEGSGAVVRFLIG